MELIIDSWIIIGIVCLLYGLVREISTPIE